MSLAGYVDLSGSYRLPGYDSCRRPGRLAHPPCCYKQSITAAIHSDICFFWLQKKDFPEKTKSAMLLHSESRVTWILTLIMINVAGQACLVEGEGVETVMRWLRRWWVRGSATTGE